MACRQGKRKGWSGHTSRRGEFWKLVHEYIIFLTLLRHATQNMMPTPGPLFSPSPSSQQTHLSNGVSSPLAKLPDLPTHKDLLRSLNSGCRGSTTCPGLCEAFLPDGVLLGLPGPGTASIKRMPYISSQNFTVTLTFPTRNQRRGMNRKGKMWSSSSSGKGDKANTSA